MTKRRISVVPEIMRDAGYVTIEEMEKAVKAEREECARICDRHALPDGVSLTALNLAKAIRARK